MMERDKRLTGTRRVQRSWPLAPEEFKTNSLYAVFLNRILTDNTGGATEAILVKSEKKVNRNCSLYLRIPKGQLMLRLSL